MYRFISLCCSLVFIIGITACSKDKPEEQASTPHPEQQQTAPEEQAGTSEPEKQEVIPGAGVVLDGSKTLDLDAKPIDIATSGDGKYIFILAEGGKVIVFDVSGKVKGTLKVSESVVSVDTSPNGDFLLLADSKDNTLEMVKISFVVDINITGLPFKGPANAPVVVAVFSDYQ